jgi:hypothetical protein
MIPIPMAAMSTTADDTFTNITVMRRAGYRPREMRTRLERAGPEALSLMERAVARPRSKSLWRELPFGESSMTCIPVRRLTDHT